MAWYEYIANWAKEKTQAAISALNNNAITKSAVDVQKTLTLPIRSSAAISVASSTAGVNALGKSVGLGGIFNVNGMTDMALNPNLIKTPALDKLLSIDYGDSGLNISPAVTMFNDSQKEAGKTQSESAIPDFPFWIKTAIVSSILIGTVLIVKGVMTK